MFLWKFLCKNVYPNLISKKYNIPSIFCKSIDWVNFKRVVKWLPFKSSISMYYNNQKIQAKFLFVVLTGENKRIARVRMFFKLSPTNTHNNRYLIQLETIFENFCDKIRWNYFWNIVMTIVKTIRILNLSGPARSRVKFVSKALFIGMVNVLVNISA